MLQKKYPALFFLLTSIVFTIQVKSQNRNERLAGVVNSPSVHDTIKVKKLFEIAKMAEDSGKIDSALALLDHALLLSQKNNYTNGIINCFLYKGDFYIDKVDFLNAEINFQRSLELANQYKNTEAQAHSVYGLGWAYCRQGDYSKGVNFLKKSRELSRKNKIIHYEIWSTLRIGEVNLRAGDFKEAQQDYTTALKLAQSINDELLIGISYFRFGTIYSGQGNYNQALNNYLIALKYYEKVGERGRIASVYNNMSDLYLKLNNLEKAEYYAEKSARMFKAIYDDHSEAFAIGNLGEVYKRQKKYEKAINAQSHALELFAKHRNNRMIGDVNLYLGEIYFLMNDYPKAASFLQQSIDINRKYNFPKELGIALSKLSEVQIETGNLASAKANLYEALGIAKKMGDKENRIAIYATLAKLSSTLSDYKNAYYYYKEYASAKDSVFNATSSKQIAEMQTKYETEKKEKENTLLLQQNQLQQAEIEKRNLVLILLGGLFVFAIFIFVFVYTRYQLKQKTLMAQELNYQQKLRFKAIMDAEENERRRVAQELHDGLGQLLSTAKLHVSALENTSSSDETPVKNALSLIDNAIDEVRAISHNMMPSALIRLGLISALKELTRKINNSNTIKIELTAEMNERLHEKTEVAIYRIVQESVNNMLKHSNASSITIRLNKKNDSLVLEIKDNGIGFDTSLIEKSSGIGWKNIYARTAFLNGNVEVKSAAAKGTTICIRIPDLFIEKKS